MKSQYANRLHNFTAQFPPHFYHAHQSDTWHKSNAILISQRHRDVDLTQHCRCYYHIRSQMRWTLGVAVTIAETDVQNSKHSDELENSYCKRDIIFIHMGSFWNGPGLEMKRGFRKRWLDLEQIWISICSNFDLNWFWHTKQMDVPSDLMKSQSHELWIEQNFPIALTFARVFAVLLSKTAWGISKPRHIDKTQSRGFEIRRDRMKELMWRCARQHRKHVPVYHRS